MDQAFASDDERLRVFLPERTSGGLTDLLEVIGRCELMITVEAWDRLYQDLRDVELFAPPETGQRDPACSRRSYFDLVGTPEGTAFEAAFQGLSSVDRTAKSFCDDYSRRVKEALENEFYVKVEISRLVKMNLRHTCESMVSSLCDFLNASPGTGITITLRVPPKRGDSLRQGVQGGNKSKPAEEFCELPGLQWKEVSITFVSDNSVKIQARTIVKTYSFITMGFADTRKVDQPDSRWVILRSMAEAGGEISRKNKGTLHRLHASVKTAVKEIRQRLQEFLGISDDPFCSYRKVRAYKPKFKLIDGRPADPNQREDD